VIEEPIPAEQWSTKEDIAAALARFESAVPGWEAPHAYGIGLATEDDTVFPVINVRAHYLPAVVLARVCGHRCGSAVYRLSAERLDQVIEMLAPAEACADYEHPNLQAWRRIRKAIGDTAEYAVAVFVGHISDPVTDTHDARFRFRLSELAEGPTLDADQSSIR
jgi:hypothetical protein